MNNQWMPREKWNALVRGENCPLCNEVSSYEEINEHGFIISRLKMSVLRLSLNQYVQGYCVLICNQHIREPYELAPVERQQYFEDMTNVGEVLEKLYDPIKMNFQILGNAVPHLHCHIIPRYYGDDAPGRPIDPGAEQRLLTPEEYKLRVQEIRAALD
jgi:diadenosine tetraphosphate (Ap4A) HIT family hydrolase